MLASTNQLIRRLAESLSETKNAELKKAVAEVDVVLARSTRERHEKFIPPDVTIGIVGLVIEVGKFAYDIFKDYRAKRSLPNEDQINERIVQTVLVSLDQKAILTEISRAAAQVVIRELHRVD